MALTSADVVNRAIQMISGYNNEAPVIGTPPNFDGSQAGVAAGILYDGVVQTVARLHGYDFSRATAALALSGNVAPAPWTFEYIYPSFGVQVRQVLPVTVDPNNPIPINWSVGNTLVAAVQSRVIYSRVPLSVAVFTNQPTEAVWDSLFVEAVVRQLASELAMALTGRPDTAGTLLESAQTYQQAGAGRDD